MDQLRSQVHMVKEVMRENINTVAEREEKFEDLGERADRLWQNADMLQRTASRLGRKLCWQDSKLWLILISILVVIVIAIVTIVAT